MIGKASEIKVKQLFSQFIDNPEWSANKPAANQRYLHIGLDEVLNEFLNSLGDAEIIDLRYQMGVSENVCDSVLVIYKEAKPSVYEERGMLSL